MDYYDYSYRVRYGDTDKMGVAYYGNYLAWFEAARTEYFRKLGLPYTECEKQGYFLPAVEASIKYISPCTYDDLLLIRTSVSELKKSALKFEYQTFLPQTMKLLTTGWTVHVCVDQQFKPTRLPQDICSAVQVYSLLQCPQ